MFYLNFRGRPAEKFYAFRQFIHADPEAWGRRHHIEWTEDLEYLRRYGTRWWGCLCNLPAVDLVVNHQALQAHFGGRVPDGPLPKGTYEERRVQFPNRRYRPDGPNPRHMLDEVGVLDILYDQDKTVRDALARITTGTSSILVILMPRFRIVSGGPWWARKVDAAATSEGLRTALRPVWRQGQLLEQVLWAVCHKCGQIFRRGGHVGACEDCRTIFTRGQRNWWSARKIDFEDLLATRYPGVDYKRWPPEPSRLQQRTESGALISVVFGDGSQGSVEARVCLELLPASGLRKKGMRSPGNSRLYTRIGLYENRSLRARQHGRQGSEPRDAACVAPGVRAGAGGAVASEFVDHAPAMDLRVRTAWRELLDQAARRRVDLVLVWRIDRAFRSVLDAATTLERLRAWGVGLRFYAEPWLDTTSPFGEALYYITAAYAQLERGILSERVKAGMARAKRQGAHVGRPAVLSGNFDVLRPPIEAGTLSRRQAARRLGVSISTVSRSLLRKSSTKKTL